MPVSDSTIVKLIELATTNQAQSNDMQYTINLVITICILPVCWMLIKYFFKKHEESMTAISDGMNNLAHVVEKTSDDIKTQVLRSALQDRDIKDLQEAKYEHLKFINELQSHKNEVEKALFEIKHKHNATNELALRGLENIEDLQSQLDDLNEKIETEIKSHDSCTNFKPLHRK